MLIVNEPSESSGMRHMMATDPRRVNAVNFVAVHGVSTHGKTSLARALSACDDFLWIHADSIFDKKVAPRINNKDSFLSYRGEPDREHFNIGKYVDSDSYDHELFTRLLSEEVHRRLQQSPTANFVLLDGYVFKHHERVFSCLGIPQERTLTLQATITNGRRMVDTFDVTGHQYDQVRAYIRKTFQAKCVETTIPKSNYQDFQGLGLRQSGSKTTDSDTPAKYDASQLNKIIQPLHHFVDIGCNAGYYCFRVAENTIGSVVGVDTARRWLEIASHVNNSIFLRNNVAFVQAEAVEFLSETAHTFDIVHCASTYHYFRQRQEDFLRSARQALRPVGTLVIEVELADGDDKPEVIQRSRGVDSVPCWFPNRAKFLDQISNLFHIEAEFASVFQRGSFYPRTYFHLRPV